MPSRNTHFRRLSISALFLALLTVNSAWAFPPQADQDALFNQAVDAYNKNQFAQAIATFQRVSGPHAQDAQQYIKKMKSYQEAVAVAKGIMDRTADERDANSLEYAIQQLTIAIKIKSDGPWDPAGQVAKARELKAQVEKQRAAPSKAMNTDFCAKALAAAEKRHYKEAAQYSCAVSNDNPGYSCGGNEAVYLCQLNTEMSKLPENAEKERIEKPKIDQPPDKVIKTTPDVPATLSTLDKAKAAYDKNDFDRARTLFQRADADSKPAATEYLTKISNYTDAITLGENFSRTAQYDQARTAFLTAATIKPDGPGDPQARVSRMELFLGLDQFYSGDYTSSIQHLQSCAKTGLQKQPLVSFYLGAAELAKFFLTGSEDPTLHQQALSDLKQAKQSGFKAPTPDLSPKLLQVYKDL